jgi:2-keto-4-pentenoate hydratase/2-oxohepta-3-ene-1,7-dioic acid hydratase in catechol pathway
MHIARLLTKNGPMLARAHADGHYTHLRGDLFGPLHDTGELIEGPLLAPLEPRAILCIGLNYRAHAVETNAPLPSFPVLFFKNPASLNHPGGAIEIPRFLPSAKVDWECELAVIIGRTCRNVLREEALDYVLGYTCGNDVSARDWQKEGGSQWCRGKSFDTFCPLGPIIVTTDELPAPNALGIRTRVNGETLQESNTSDMIFDIPTLIEFLSASTTLLPGTVILTGTPSGVGMARNPPRFLAEGDVVEVEIDQIGTLRNTVALEAAEPSGRWKIGA